MENVKIGNIFFMLQYNMVYGTDNTVIYFTPQNKVVLVHSLKAFTNS